MFLGYLAAITSRVAAAERDADLTDITFSHNSVFLLTHFRSRVESSMRETVQGCSRTVLKTISETCS